jgi:hypothetical protein
MSDLRMGSWLLRPRLLLRLEPEIALRRLRLKLLRVGCGRQVWLPV